LTEEKSRVGILENAPPWWPNFKPPEFTEEDLCEIERYCKKIVENVSNEKGMTPMERWKVVKEHGIPDRPPVYTATIAINVSRALDCWSDSLKPGIDMWWYTKLLLKAYFAWTARFGNEWIHPYILSYGFPEIGGSSRAKLVPYAAIAMIDPAIKTEDDWDRINIIDVHRDGFFPPYLWLLRKLREFMKKHGVADVVPLWGNFCAGAFGGTQETLFGLKAGWIALRRNPEILHKGTKLNIKKILAFAKAVKDIGVDQLSVCDWPSIAGLEAYKPFDPYKLEETKAVTPPGHISMNAFDSSPTLEYMCQTGSIGMAFGCTHETPKELCRNIATKYNKVFALYPDPLIFASGPGDRIVATVKDYIKTCAGSGYLFVANATDYWTPQENIDLAVKTAKEYGAEVYRGLK
jgi:hypothetical protein